MKHILLCILVLAFTVVQIFSQVDNSRLNKVLAEIDSLDTKRDSLLNLIETIKLNNLKSDLLNRGLPELLVGEELICHSAYCLVYNEDHEMAKWVAHILSREIVNGNVSRTNDFREDSLIITGSSQEADYFTKEKLEDGTYIYDGYGYDRGHLAPSADFRWSEKALSESYYYSNMTPQLPEFNREIWADIEDILRAYVYHNPTKDIYIVTAPVLTDDLPKQSRSINNMSIPELHYKIAVDFEDEKGIAFLVPQKKNYDPIEAYVVSIDSIESLTGINFYPNLTEEQENKIEANVDISLWQSGKAKNDVAPMHPEDLPRNSYNTVQAKQFYDYPKGVSICGTIVSTHKSRNGHIFINLDKSFPNQIFSATIWKSNIVNFSYQPEVFLLNKQVCIKGKVKDYQGTPSIYPDNERKIRIIE
ncbi:MAG: DNA/RNA non-specific endonuclease [Bacteroidales bacterium]|nr:DNA/RNA non-specific endonuclease [Bacteroidales bacterium]